MQLVWSDFYDVAFRGRMLLKSKPILHSIVMPSFKWKNPSVHIIMHCVPVSQTFDQMVLRENRHVDSSKNIQQPQMKSCCRNWVFVCSSLFFTISFDKINDHPFYVSWWLLEEILLSMSRLFRLILTSHENIFVSYGCSFDRRWKKKKMLIWKKESFMPFER